MISRSQKIADIKIPNDWTYCRTAFHRPNVYYAILRNISRLWRTFDIWLWPNDHIDMLIHFKSNALRFSRPWGHSEYKIVCLILKWRSVTSDLSEIWFSSVFKIAFRWVTVCLAIAIKENHFSSLIMKMKVMNIDHFRNHKYSLTEK